MKRRIKMRRKRKGNICDEKRSVCVSSSGIIATRKRCISPFSSHHITFASSNTCRTFLDGHFAKQNNYKRDLSSCHALLTTTELWGGEQKTKKIFCVRTLTRFSRLTFHLFDFFIFVTRIYDIPISL